MNDKAEPDPRDIIGWTNDGLVTYIFNVGRKDQLIKMFTPDQAEKVADMLLGTVKEIREKVRVQ